MKTIIQYTYTSEGDGRDTGILLTTDNPAKALHQIIDDLARNSQYGFGFILRKIEILGNAREDECG